MRRWRKRGEKKKRVRVRVRRRVWTNVLEWNASLSGHVLPRSGGDQSDLAGNGLCCERMVAYICTQTRTGYERKRKGIRERK
jgi:hypothetical protein